jgi:hypothetical protein
MRKLVTVEVINEVRPIEGADAIDSLEEFDRKTKPLLEKVYVKPKTKEEIVDNISITSISKREMLELFQEYATLCVPKKLEMMWGQTTSYSYDTGYNAAIEEMFKNIG